MEEKKQKIRERVVEQIDCATGEIIKETNITEYSSESEPDYIKLYLDDIAMLNDLPKNTSGVLYHLIARMNYDNIILINKFIRDSIATALDLKPNTIDHAITKFISKGILSKVASGTYIANPKLFGKGKWKNIRQLRLSITYNKNGKTFELQKDTFLSQREGISQFID